MNIIIRFLLVLTIITNLWLPCLLITILVLNVYKTTSSETHTVVQYNYFITITALTHTLTQA